MKPKTKKPDVWSSLQSVHTIIDAQPFTALHIVAGCARVTTLGTVIMYDMVWSRKAAILLL